MKLTPFGGDPFALMPIEGNPFDQTMALQDYARTLPAAQPPIGQPGGAPLDDFAPAPVSAAAPQPTFPGLADVAGDPSRSLAVRLPAAIGSSLADQGRGLAQSMWGAATLPGDVAKGLVDPNSMEAVRRSTDLAGVLTLPAAETGAVADPNVLGAFSGGWFHGSDKLAGTPNLEHFGTGAFQELGSPDIVKSYFPAIYATDSKPHAARYGNVHNLDLDTDNFKTINAKEQLEEWATENGYNTAQEMIDNYYDGDIYNAYNADQEFSHLSRNSIREGNSGVIVDFGNLVHNGRFKLGRVAIIGDQSAVRLTPK